MIESQASFENLWENVKLRTEFRENLGDDYEFVRHATESTWNRLQDCLPSYVTTRVMELPADLAEFDCGCSFGIASCTRRLVRPKGRTPDEYAEYVAAQFEREFINDIYPVGDDVVGFIWAPYWLIGRGASSNLVIGTGPGSGHPMWFTRYAKKLHTKDQCAAIAA